jgi:hypothetical protein
MISQLLVLQARAEARSILFRAGDYKTFEQATAPLRDYALSSGIIDQIGADGVIAIINTAFGVGRDG